MSIARHHSDWLSLVEVSGPFLSLPVLMRAFPSGVEKATDESELFRRLRLAYEEWDDSTNPMIHQQWIKFVLGEVLDLSSVIAEGQAIPQSLYCQAPEHGETLRPSGVVITPQGRSDAGKERLLLQTYPADQDLDKPVDGKPWKISPGTRMMELCHATGIRLGLVTNGYRWMLVDAPKNETTGFASWYVQDWLDFPDGFRSFRSLLGLERFFNVADKDTLESLLAESASNQQEVTDQLGYQVRNAVETLIQALDKADQEHARALLKDVSETELYEAALNVMMRLVFLFCAEERGLLLLGDPLYNENYAVSTLRERLRETADQQGEEILERRHDAWCRLLSTFRAVHGGVEHERMSIPAYAGHLFDPDRFTFLEGRKRKTEWHDTPADPLPVNNRTVLHLLESLQLLQVRVPGGGPAEARRLSFRALDIEQIGHVYEGLLDHTAKRATEPVLGLAGTRDKEPEVSLAKLEALKKQGEDELLDFLKEETGRSLSALRNSLEVEIESEDASRFLTACGDKGLLNKVQPFAGFVRLDSYGYPVVIPKGSVYVTSGTDRRSSGTHYTPKSLTEPIVQYTLEPLVYVGPAEGKPKEEWKLRTAKELLDLKICDMACGSGAFLVQACRYLSELVVEAWEKAEAEIKSKHGPKVDAAAITITPYGEEATGKADEQLIPKDADERLTYARRLVAQRCLYGVDINPLAVEMAKLSLWLLTLAKDRPFTFLDHAIRCGDSLVGISDTKQLERFSLSGEGLNQPLLQEQIKRRLEATRLLRKQIAELPDTTPQDVERKELMLSRAEEQAARLRYAADMLVAASWQPMSEQDRTEELKQMLLHVEHRFKDLPVEQLEADAKAKLKDVGCNRTFHWPLEFPEVFGNGRGLDAIVGNPPFVGGRRIRSSLGDGIFFWLTETAYPGSSGNGDLCAFFFRRAHDLAGPNAVYGLVATNTIAQADTRSVGLAPITANGGTVIRGTSSRIWPGTANVFISEVWVSKLDWHGLSVLDQRRVSGIGPDLCEPLASSEPARRLVANQDKAFNGSYVLGMGFVLNPEEAKSLIERNPSNRSVLFPYLNGQELNAHPKQLPQRWVINFFDWPLRRGAKGSWENADDKRRKEWLLTGVVPNDYADPVAADFPDCLAIVEERVKPERTRTKPNGEFALRRPLPQRWWIYADKRPALYSTIADMRRVIVRAQVSRTHAPIFYKPGIVFSNMLVVFALDDGHSLAVLQSNLHESWLDQHSSSLKEDRRYTPSDSFDTFPFPPHSARCESSGEAYHRHRQEQMKALDEGLTSIYNRFHNASDKEVGIVQLRQLHVELDCSVAAAYGWDDLDLGHGFHDTKLGNRFTIGESARREILTRLLRLNHERYAEEVAQGLHDTKSSSRGASTGGRAKRTAKKSNAQMLPGFDDDEPEPERKAGKESNGLSSRRRSGNTVEESRSLPVDQLETDEIMAAFRQVVRGRGWLDRHELVKEVSVSLGYQRLGPNIEEALRNHLRAAIRRRIVEADGRDFVRAGTATMTDYTLDELRECFSSVMRKGTNYEREDVIYALARYLGFARLTETIRQPIKSAINSAIRHGLLGYEGSVVWRE